MKNRIVSALILILAGSCASAPPEKAPANPAPTPVTERPPLNIPPVETPGTVEKPPVETPPADTLTIARQLELFRTTGNPTVARKAVENEIGLESLTLTDRAAYAGLLMAEGRQQDAKNEYLGVLKNKPEDRDSLLALAVLAGSEGNFTAQQEYLDRLLKAYPQDPEALATQGFAHLAQERLDRAESFFNRSLGVKDNPDAREGMARIKLIGEKWQDALNQTDAGLALDAQRDSLYALRSQANIGLEKLLAAEEDLNKAIALAPAYSWHYLDRARLRWRALYKADQALEDLATVLKVEPDNFFALIYRGEILESKDDAAGAYKDFVKAISIRPDYRYAYPSLAILSFQAKDWERARNYALKSWTMHAGEYAFPWIAALSSRFLGKEADAKSVLEQAFKQYANQPLIQEMCRFLITPTVSFGLDDGLAREKSPVVKHRLMFYQGVQYALMNRPQSAQALWEPVAALDLKNVPEIRMAKAFMAAPQ